MKVVIFFIFLSFAAIIFANDPFEAYDGTESWYKGAGNSTKAVVYYDPSYKKDMKTYLAYLKNKQNRSKFKKKKKGSSIFNRSSKGSRKMDAKSDGMDELDRVKDSENINDSFKSDKAKAKERNSEDDSLLGDLKDSGSKKETKKETKKEEKKEEKKDTKSDDDMLDDFDDLD